MPNRVPFAARYSRSENRLLFFIGIVLGLLHGYFLTALMLVFAGGAAGNAGATTYFKFSFTPATWAVFGAYVVLSLLLFFLHWHRVALLVAWAPAVLLFVVLPALSELRDWFL